ncbi:MAG: hypothetical protein ACREA0_19900, partial [bacterium]
MLALLMAFVSGACSNSSEARVDKASLTRAAASLALSVGEVVERYAAEIPATGDWTKDLDRLQAIFAQEPDALGLETVMNSFLAAATASRNDGFGRVQTARQLVAAAWLSSEAFRPPQFDYRPEDQDMSAAIASSLERQLNVALASTYDFETGARHISDRGDLGAILSDAFLYVMLVAGYNQVDPNGSHPVRDRLQALRTDNPPVEFIDQAGNLRLPQGSEPEEQIARFEDWR